MAGTSADMDDVVALLDDLLPFARQMLSEHREFLPFGAHTQADGSIVWEGARNGDELPLSQDLIDILREAHRDRAERHEIWACALVYDIRTVPPGRSQKQDAICVDIDHQSGYSAHYVYPYLFDGLGRLVVEDEYVLSGAASIFARADA